MDLYLLGSKTGAAVVSAGNREQAIRVGTLYFKDIAPDAEPPVITTAVRIEAADNCRVVAATATA